jgi:hypothetical protein
MLLRYIYNFFYIYTYIPSSSIDGVTDAVVCVFLGREIALAERAGEASAIFRDGFRRGMTRSLVVPLLLLLLPVNFFRFIGVPGTEMLSVWATGSGVVGTSDGNGNNDCDTGVVSQESEILLLAVEVCCC